MPRERIYLFDTTFREGAPAGATALPPPAGATAERPPGAESAD